MFTCFILFCQLKILIDCNPIIEALMDTPAAIMDAKTTTPVDKPNNEKKLKPCCVCLETKKARDECIIQNGEENCHTLIEAHKICLRNLGFEI